jgi:hypothetical protein
MGPDAGATANDWYRHWIVEGFTALEAMAPEAWLVRRRGSPIWPMSASFRKWPMPGGLRRRWRRFPSWCGLMQRCVR